MPASISLTNLSWSTPDNTPLFQDLTLGFGPERTGIVGRNGTGKSTLLQLIAGKTPPTSGQIRCTGTLAFMRQDIGIPPGATIADLFNVGPALAVLDRAARGEATAAELADADWTLPDQIEAALQRCGLQASAETQLAQLSGGQRSRAALAAAILHTPDFLLLDEPTNNLDGSGRQAVIDLIQSWRGGALIVSHDRALLEEMDAIVELTPLGVTRTSGNYSAFRARKEAALTAAAHDLTQAARDHKEAARRTQEASERKKKRDRAGEKSRSKGDQPKIMLDAAKGRAEASAGAGARLRTARQEATAAALVAAKEKIEVLQPMRMDIPSTGLTTGRPVISVDSLGYGYDASHPIIRNMSFTLNGPERLVIAGANGSGKTTLLQLLTGQLQPQQGTAAIHVPYAVLDQHVGLLRDDETLRDAFCRLNPPADVHRAHIALARFGFRAEDGLQEVGTLSGGQRLRAGLACTLGGMPQLLILDEPTNHLDLDGITALESALARYDGALVIVSHDTAFLTALQPTRIVTLSTAP